MITRADEYPIHQTAEPLAYVATSDRNFYDRFFFNGYSRDGSVYFAAAMGFYPNRHVCDAAFSIVYLGRQYVVRASRLLGGERMDTHIAPIGIDVVEPLIRIRLRIEPNEFGIEGDLLFTRRAPVIEEPHFFRRINGRVFLDYTRLTQHGDWSGTLRIEGRSIDVGAQRYWGSRDRSWGVRPVGERDAGAPSFPMQFFWLWAPVNFDDLCSHFDVNEEASGERWHEVGVVATTTEGVLTPCSADYRLTFQPGTRHVRSAVVTLQPANEEPLGIELEPLYNFYMIGLGYGHPEWGHGMYRGDYERSGESFALSDVDPSAPMHLHVQAICRAKAGNRTGIGILEQLILGPHQPTGLEGLFDPAR